MKATVWESGIVADHSLFYVELGVEKRKTIVIYKLYRKNMETLMEIH